MYRTRVIYFCICIALLAGCSQPKPARSVTTDTMAASAEPAPNQRQTMAEITASTVITPAPTQDTRDIKAIIGKMAVEVQYIFHRGDGVPDRFYELVDINDDTELLLISIQMTTAVGHGGERNDGVYEIISFEDNGDGEYQAIVNISYSGMGEEISVTVRDVDGMYKIVAYDKMGDGIYATIKDCAVNYYLQGYSKKKAHQLAAEDVRVLYGLNRWSY